MNYEFQILPKEDAFVAGAFVFMRNKSEVLSGKCEKSKNKNK